MANLKDLRRRIASIRSTQKITGAMKMIAAAKFRKNHHAILEGRLLSYHLYDVSTKIVNSFQQQAKEKSPVLMSGGPQDAPKLLIIFGADQGLCGDAIFTLVQWMQFAISKMPVMSHSI
jgi:F-type H+-transporting ATPase subunit gamma